MLHTIQAANVVIQTSGEIVVCRRETKAKWLGRCGDEVSALRGAARAVLSFSPTATGSSSTAQTSPSLFCTRSGSWSVCAAPTIFLR